jgi:hypothetical protein
VRTLALRPDLLDDAAWEECARLGLLAEDTGRRAGYPDSHC